MISKFKWYIVIILLSSSCMYGNNAENQSDGVNWLTFEEAVEKAEENPKKIFIDIYTDWCGYCKRMESNTFSNPVISQILNERFYPVKLNAEQDEPIMFQGNEFVNENPGQRRSPHNFAVAIMQGQMSYPTVAFFDEELNLITTLPGYRPPENLEPILMFFYDDEYKNTSDLEDYIDDFEGSVE